MEPILIKPSAFKLRPIVNAKDVDSILFMFAVTTLKSLNIAVETFKRSTFAINEFNTETFVKDVFNTETFRLGTLNTDTFKTEMFEIEE